MIELRKIGEDLYEVTASPPHVDEAWSSTEPIGAHELIDRLLGRGAHVVDVMDELHAQDPDWDAKARGRNS
jgi:hypothetical protein